jgi:hypothetical protein
MLNEHRSCSSGWCACLLLPCRSPPCVQLALAASPLAAFPVPGQQHPRQQQASLQPPVMPLPEPPCAAAAAAAEGRAASDQPEWDVHASSCLLSDTLQSSAPKAETQPPPQGHQHQPNGSRQPSLSSNGGSEAADSAAAAEGGSGPGSQLRGKEKGRGSGAYEDLLQGYVGGKRAQQSRQGGLPAGEGQETALPVCGLQVGGCDTASLGALAGACVAVGGWLCSIIASHWALLCLVAASNGFELRRTCRPAARTLPCPAFPSASMHCCCMHRWCKCNTACRALPLLLLHSFPL